MKVNDNVFKFSKKILKLFNEKKVDLIENGENQQGIQTI